MMFDYSLKSKTSHAVACRTESAASCAWDMMHCGDISLAEGL